MKHRLSVLRLSGASLALATAAIAASAGLAMPATALAADSSVGSITYYKSGSDMPHPVLKTYTDCGTLINDVRSWATTSDVTKVVVSLDADWNTNSYGCIKIPDGSNVELNLNGHMINRGLANMSFDGSVDGDVIKVGKNATLTVNGGDDTTKHMGSLLGESIFWISDGVGRDAIEGGLITGGASSNNDKSGGGITTTGANAKLYLNDVTIAGNVSDTFEGGGGNGGGICVRGANSTLTLDGATVIYNRSQGYGGGLYINGNDSAVTLKGNSIIRNNSADEDGGGIYHDGKRGTVTIKEKSDINSNIAAEDGGGIYDNYNGTTYTISDSQVSFNQAQGQYSFWRNTRGNGGGICLNDDSDLKLTNGAKIWYNTSVRGGGVFADDDGIEVSLESGSSIRNNTATDYGGGVYFRDECTLTLSNSTIYHNNAFCGGGVMLSSLALFTDTDSVIDLKDNSKIYDNSASGSGGGIYVDSNVRLDPTVTSSDGTGMITNNSAKDGGAIYVGTMTTIKGLNIKNNTSQRGGAVYTSSSLVIEGKNVIEDNYVGDKKANLCITDYASLREGKNAPSTDSSIGICFDDNCDDDERIAYDQESLVKLAAYPCRALHTDDPSESIEIDGDDLNRSKSPSKFTLSVYGADDALTEKAVAYNGKVELKSADYAKSCCTLVSWTVVGVDGTTSIVPQDGVASFTMPAGNVTVRANYSSVLSSVQLNLSDGASWSDLGSDASTAEVSSLRLIAADGSSYGLTTTSDIRKVLKVTNVKAASTEAGKTATYTIELDNAVLKGYGLTYNAASFEGASVEARATFGTASDSKADTVSASAERIVLEAGVTYLTPEDAVTINAVNVNKANTDAKPFDTVVEEAEQAVGSDGIQTKQVIKRIKIKTPDEPGWTFSSWLNLPDSAEVDPTDNSVTLDADDAKAKLLALYEPLVSAIAISVDEPKVGEKFPTTINSCLMAGANERDLTKYVQSAVKVNWTLADGMPAGDTVQADTIYKVKLHAENVENSYIFGADDSVYTTVNGAKVYSTEYDAGSKTGNIVYYVKTGEDTSFDYAIDNMPTLTVASADAIADSLPASAYYVLKNGVVKTADVTWDTSSIDTGAQIVILSVNGVFKDEAGDEHSVTQSVVVSDEAAPIEATYSIDKAIWNYSKGGCAPYITVKVGDKTLAKDAGYTVSYANNDKVGIATVTVTGAGDYIGIGTREFTYKIIPAKVKVKAVKSAAKHKVKVSWKSHKAQTTGFEVRYAASKAKVKAGKGTTVKVKKAFKTAKVIKGLKSNKKTYVQVRSYTKAADGVTYYSKWSKVKAVKVK